MFLVQTRLFGSSLESTFPAAIPYAKVDFAHIGTELLANFGMQGLLPEQISLVKRDDLFDYELKFELFRGSATCSINAGRLRLSFVNARFAQEVTTMIDVAVRCYRCFNLPIGTIHRVDATAHFAFETPKDFGDFFTTKGTRWAKDFAQVGLIASLADPDWEEPIRVVIEPSKVIDGGGFIMPSTFFRDAVVSADVLSKILGVFERSADQCQIKFNPLP